MATPVDRQGLYSHRWDRPTFDAMVDRAGLRPTKLHVQVTARCSHRCLTCNHHVRAPRTDGLGGPTVLRLLAEARDMGMDNLSLTGGEPLLRRDLHEVVGAARSAGFSTVTVATNGDLLADRAEARRLLEAGTTHVPMSLQGWATHDEMVGAPGSRERVVRAVENLLALTGGDADRVTVGMVATERTLGELDPVADFARRAGCGLRVNVLDRKLFFFAGETESERLWPTDETAIRRFVDRCFELSAEGLLRLWPRNIVFLERYMLERPIESPCPVGLEALYVSHDGRLFPGCWAKDTGLTVREVSLGEAWASPRYRDLLHDAFSRRCGGCGCTFRTMSAFYVPYVVEGWVRTGRVTR